MASIGHALVGTALARHAPGSRPRAALLLAALAMLPDADVVGFALGIPYGAEWGHRGASHSLCFAAGVALVCALCARIEKLPALRVGLLCLLAIGTHGLLDTLTDGGKGIALLWPFSAERLFAPWQPLPVSPIGRAVLGPRGLRVLGVELVYFLPLLVYSLLPRSGSGRA